MAEPVKIERTAILVVSSTKQNQYGDLIVTDKEGTEHKVGNKRPHLFDQFQENRAVEVGYSSYMNREYIAAAHLVEGELPDPKESGKMPVEHTEKAPSTVKTDTESVKIRSMAIAPDNKNRSFALSYAKDIYCARITAGKTEFKTSQIIIMAHLFNNWLNGDDSSIGGDEPE